MSANTILIIRIFLLLFFLLSYYFIIHPRFNHTAVALFAASLVVLFKFISLQEAIGYIDFETLGLLLGMMLLTTILKDTGIIELLAIRAVALSRGHLGLMLFYVMAATAIISSLLDNITSVLLIGPIIIFLTSMLHKNPYPFMLGLIFSSNLGGTATLIGDPPNILVASASGLTFLDFIVHVAPVALILFFVSFFFIFIMFYKDLSQRVSLDHLPSDNKKLIKNFHLMKIGLVILGFVILLFTFSHCLDLRLSAIAMGGGALLMIISRKTPAKIFAQIEWDVMMFFMSLFIIIGSLDKWGLLELLAANLTSLSDNIIILSIIIMITAGILSGIIGSIPFTVAFIPVVREIALNLQGHDLVIRGGTSVDLFPDSLPLWLALSLGACLGGLGTIFAGSPNLVIANLSEKTSQPIRFMNYLKAGLPLTCFSLIIGGLYIYLRYS